MEQRASPASFHLRSLPDSDYDVSDEEVAERFRQAKAVLQNQLFDNLLFLAGDTKDPEMCALFFDQSLLENPESPADEEPVPVTPWWGEPLLPES